MLLEVSSNMPMRSGRSDCLLKKRISWRALSSETLKSPFSSSGTSLLRRSSTVARTSTRFTSVMIRPSWVICVEEAGFLDPGAFPVSWYLAGGGANGLAGMGNEVNPGTRRIVGELLAQEDG